MTKRKPPAVPATTTPANEFEAVVAMIRAARARAAAAVNTALIDLYWRIGERLSGKLATGEWGEGTVQSLAHHIRQTQPAWRAFRPKTFGACGSCTTPTRPRRNSQHC